MNLSQAKTVFKMSKPGVIKIVMVSEVNDSAKAKEKLPAMIDNARKMPGCLNFDFCEMVKHF